MRQYLQMMKRWDVIILLLFVPLSFIPLAVFGYQQGSVGSEATTVAVITVDRQERRRISLSGHQGVEVFNIRGTGNQSNTIEVKDGSIRIKSATCTDQVCVHMGSISRPGRTLVCLPHRVVVEIQSSAGEDMEEIIISS